MSIVIVPLGRVDADLLQHLQERVSTTLRCFVLQGRARPVPASAYDPSRKQYLATALVGWLQRHTEHLEHVVSDRLIARIDEMLGRPVVDPHGDPIPDAEGAFERRNAQNLLTCPLGTPVTVTRVVDQDKAFLRFIESHDLKPGQSIVVEARDTASDSVRLRGSGAHSITIGARAASKLLVEVG